MYIREIRPGFFKFLGAQNAHCQDYYYCHFKVMKRLYFAVCVKNHSVFVFTTIMLTARADKMLIPSHPPGLQNGVFLISHELL